jgi:oxygen-independent coproporphyrinogen III oxidase
MMTQIDREVVSRYDVPTPRYTSYPTALQFASLNDMFCLDEAIAQTNAVTRPVSLYFHLPFCASLCWYCGCATVISDNADKKERYTGLLLREFAQRSAAIHADRPVVQVHLGGGTPTAMSPEQLERLGRAVWSRLRPAPDAEISVEVDPRRTTAAHLDSLIAGLGVNRLSFGVQDVNPEVQEAIHRVQPWEMTAGLAKQAHERGIDALNLDLIYGLPRQTPERWQHTLEAALSLEPGRLALYSYAHVPWMKPAQMNLERAGLPGAEEKLALMLQAQEVLQRAGYVHIGLDHFARPDDALALAQRDGSLQRNFQGYSTRAGADVWAFGMTAISQIGDRYIQRYKDLTRWEQAVERGESTLERGVRLSQDDIRRRHIIMELMCRSGLDLEQVGQALGVQMRAEYARELEQLSVLEADGLLEWEGERMRLTPTGRVLMRTVASRFDAYWSPGGAGRHASAV